MPVGLESSAFRVRVSDVIDDSVLKLETSTLALELWLESNAFRVRIRVRGRVGVRMSRLFSVRVREHLEVGVVIELGLGLGFVLVDSRFWVRLRVSIACWVRIECIPG